MNMWVVDIFVKNVLHHISHAQTVEGFLIRMIICGEIQEADFVQNVHPIINC